MRAIKRLARSTKKIKAGAGFEGKPMEMEDQFMEEGDEEYGTEKEADDVVDISEDET